MFTDVHAPAHWLLASSLLLLAAASPVNRPPAPARRLWQVVTLEHALGPGGPGMEHWQAVRRAAFSADGRVLAVAGDAASGMPNVQDTLVCVWRLNPRRQVALLRGRDTDSTELVALSADGSLVAAGCSRGTLLWSVADGRLLARIPGGCAALGFQGRPGRLLVLAADGTMTTWAGGRSRSRRTGLKGLLSGAFLADGRRLVALKPGRAYWRLHADWYVVAADVAAGRVLARVRALHSARMQYFSVARATGRAAVFSWYDDATVLVDALRGRRLARHENGAWRHELAISPDGRLLTHGSRDGAVGLADALTGRALDAGRVGTSFVEALCWSDDGKLVAAVSEDDDTHDATARVWRLSR